NMTDLKKQLEKLKNIRKRLEEYKKKVDDYQAEVDKQILERKERESTQWGWGQAVNLVPIVSHAYDLATSKTNEGIEERELTIRQNLLKAAEEKYEELLQELEEQIQALEEI
ncbi:31096_t:CDS:1, partial [Gigaspora margarita]